MLSRVFYGPGDWLAGRTTVRQRRALAAWALILCVFPGTPFWLLNRNAIWLIGAMSLLALWLALWGVVSAETPVEGEDG